MGGSGGKASRGEPHTQKLGTKVGKGHGKTDLKTNRESYGLLCA